MKIVFEHILPVELVFLLSLVTVFFLYYFYNAPYFSKPGAVESFFYFTMPLYFMFRLLQFLFFLLCISRKYDRLGIKNTIRLLKLYGNRFLRISLIIKDLRRLMIVSATVTLFVYLKNLIPFVNKSLYDEFLFHSERFFFLGKLCSEILAEGLPIAVSHALSNIYFLYFPFMGVSVFAIVFVNDTFLKDWFFTAFSLTWLLSVPIMYLFPTYGPCFFYPEPFQILPTTEVSTTQQFLWLLKEGHAKGYDVPIYAISGVPSLHVAIVATISIFISKLNRIIGYISWCFLGLTIISTLYFGWHYFIDVVVAVPLALFAVKIAKRLATFFNRIKQ